MCSSDLCYEAGTKSGAVLCQGMPKNLKYTAHALRLATAAAKKGYTHAYSLLGAMLKDTTDTLLKNMLHVQPGGSGLAAKCFQFAARDGDKSGMECLEKLNNEEGFVTEVDINDVKRQYKEALMMEWSEEREKENPDSYKELSL